MKQKIGKIIFIISFVPYVMIPVYGLVCAFVGVDFFFSTCYGLEAFILGIIVAGYTLLLMVPVIPVCAIYQICYLLRNRITKFSNISLKKYVKLCIAVGAVLIIGLCLHTYSFEIGKLIEKNKAIQMGKVAEEKIDFNTHTWYMSGVFDIDEYQYNQVFVDYDKCEVGILMGESFGEFWKIRLYETTKESDTYQHIVKNYFVQADIELHGPGERLVTFYKDDFASHRTIAMLLFFEDGKIYCADDITDKDGYAKFSFLNSYEFGIEENVKFEDLK